MTDGVLNIATQRTEKLLERRFKMEKMTHQSLYKRVQKTVTSDHLKNITAHIIDHYKNKQFLILRQYSHFLKDASHQRIEKLFSQLIKTYHPDRLLSIQKEIEECYTQKKEKELKRLYSIYTVDPQEISGSEKINELDNYAPYSTEHFNDNKHEYFYSKDDFGYREKSTLEEDDNFGESQLKFDEEERTVTTALNNLYFGGLDHNLSGNELATLEGELDLSDYGIELLDGIEACIYLEELFLTGNRIRKIGPLGKLYNLKTLYLSSNGIESIDALENLEQLQALDLSFNSISDISPLENLSRIEYLNIVGNPVATGNTIEKLIARGVTVVHDGFILT